MKGSGFYLGSKGLIPAIMLLLGGCIAHSGGMQSQEARSVAELVGKGCIIHRDGIKMQGISPSLVEVLSIDRGQGGWSRAEFRAYGFQDHFYWNSRSGQAACGRTSWNQLNVPFIKSLDDDEERQEEKSPAGGAPPEVRPIAISWGGMEGLIAGEVELRQGEGSVSARLPDGKGTCRGSYRATDRAVGTWAVACTDGRSASGTYRALGAGKGAVGEGFDAHGNQVRYTLGGASER